MTCYVCSLPTLKSFYGGDMTLIHESFNSKFSSRIPDFAIQNPISGIQNLKKVLDLSYMKEKEWGWVVKFAKAFWPMPCHISEFVFSSLSISIFYYLTKWTWLLSCCCRLLLYFVKLSSWQKLCNVGRGGLSQGGCYRNTPTKPLKWIQALIVCWSVEMIIDVKASTLRGVYAFVNSMIAPKRQDQKTLFLIQTDIISNET